MILAQERGALDPEGLLATDSEPDPGYDVEEEEVSSKGEAQEGEEGEEEEPRVRDRCVDPDTLRPPPPP